MPMIDVYAAAWTFPDALALAQQLAAALMAVERVPDIPMFRQNTAAFVHEMPASHLSNVDGDSTYVRVQVLTNHGALDRDKQLAVVELDGAADDGPARRQQPHDRQPGHGLAAARLPDDAEGLPGVHMQVDVADSLYDGAGELDMRRQVLDVKD